MADEWDDGEVGVQAPVVIRQKWSFNSNQANADDVWNSSGTSVSYDPRPERENRSRVFTNSGARGSGGRGGNRGRGGGGGGGYQGRNQYNSNEVSESIQVPTRFVGKVIGRGGSKIAELQSESNARINVTKDTVDDSTIVKISGDAGSVSKAKELINELTQDTIKFDYSGGDSRKEPEEKKPVILDWQKLLKDCDAAAEAEWDKYPQIKKEFYKPHPEVVAMTDEEVEAFRLENNNIVVDRTFKTENSRPIPKPCPQFYHAFYEYPEILDEIEKVGFEKPSPIQAQAWPVLLSGEDLIGIAQTGTGKTLAFLLPAMVHIDGQPGNRVDRGGPAVLIMAPTRELALQIDKEIKKYQYRGITSVCLYGGGNRSQQVKTVTAGVDIVIATPGRLNDLVGAGHLDVRPVTYVVLDEADRMLDMGFEPQIRKVMYAIRPTRQTVMTSATWPMGVRRLAQSYMVDPVQVYVGSLDLAATHTVTQVIRILPDDDNAKMEAFMEFAHNLEPDQKVITFCGKKARADELSSELVLAGLSCQTLHGDRDQSDREQALVDIKDGTVQILIATDVASRGLDIEDITHVLNYDFPRNIEEYVHRVGRTGRAGKFGESISYFTRADWAQAKELISILEEAQQYVPEELHDMAERFGAMKERREKEKESFGGRGGGRRFGGGGGGGGGWGGGGWGGGGGGGRGRRW